MKILLVQARITNNKIFDVGQDKSEKVIKNIADVGQDKAVKVTFSTKETKLNNSTIINNNR